MAFADEVKKPVNRIYADVYMKRRYPDGSFDADWIDITRYVKTDRIGRIKYTLDSGDFEVGAFVVNNMQLSFDNSAGKFNDNSDSRSYWAAFESRNLSKIKIEAGYITDDDERSEATPFTGILEEKSIVIDDNDSVSATILSLESVLKSTYVVAGSLSSSVLASDAIFILCNRAEVTDFINVSPDNINLALDVTIDNPGDYDGKKLDQALNEILLYTNSIMYVDENGDMIVKSRNNSSAVKYNFYCNSHTGATDNIYSVKSFNNGRQRVKNAWYWSGTTLSALSSDYLLQRYGVTRRSFSSGAITNNTTRQSVIDNLLSEFQFPKKELIFETDYMPGVLTFFDTITLDVKPNLSRLTDVPISGYAIAGSALSIDYITGLYIDSNIGFKIIAIEHDLRSGKTIFKVREKGNQINDGYISMVLSKVYTVSFSASTQEDITTSAEGINAQRAQVEILDTADDYKTSPLTITRPSSTTIRLSAGVAITKTFRVLVIEAEA